jgi:hypothetical protein
MEYLPVFGIMIFVISIISWLWVRGIDYMKENHPDYHGEDFLNWDEDEIDDEFSRQSKENNKKIYESDNKEKI